MPYTEHSHRFAVTILAHHYPEAKKEIEAVVVDPHTPLGRGHQPTPSKVLQARFRSLGWRTEKTVGESSLRFDALKGRVAIEIELTDPADVLNTLLKFQIANSGNQIDVGLLVVYDDSIRGTNIPKIGKAKSDLRLFSNLVFCPVWVIGLKE
ncbi:MAG: hypothetical protein HY558_04660 [Euryarchaeota archaeon]|nr:hypothetical protein [Euryarchaeota archaeon]